MKAGTLLALALTVACTSYGFLFGPKKEGAPEDDARRHGGRQRMMEVKIGAVLPLSGVVASDGEAALRGLQIAEADINAAGDLPFRVRILSRAWVVAFRGDGG